MSQLNSEATTVAGFVGNGVKVQVFEESGTGNTCLQDLLDSPDLVATDRHAYM